MENSTAEQVSGEGEVQGFNATSAVRLPFQTYPYFRTRTRTFQGAFLDIVARLAIILTALELILAIPSILATPAADISLNR
jgi:hypothetical protein